MKKRQIVNIINFIRAVEPREYVDMVKPVKEQINLMKKHSLKGTFLLQYDALISDEYTELLKELDSKQFEIGVWFEVVQPQTEDCGIEWRGRFPWDWHVHCGFSVGYSPDERKQLVDVLYEKFKETFGYYPKVFGSWFFDSVTARYVSEHYGADAFCNCKEQFGTDGYTLWGGYYGQGYYPNKDNVFLPAQNKENQIETPLFRMLGSDPVYQYDYQLDPDREEPVMQNVITLEPVYVDGGGGGHKGWVNWYMKENFNGDCLSFGYAQAGQENSFGWDKMESGLKYQFELFEKMVAEGKIEIEKLGETGRWFKETYSCTPASAICAHTAFDDENKNSVWYSTRFYRVNIYGENRNLRIRDLHIFSDSYKDPFENAVCKDNCVVYDALPVIDGNRNTGKGILAGGYITYEDGTVPTYERMEFVDNGNSEATVKYGEIEIKLFESSMIISAEKPFSVENRIGIDGGHKAQVRAVGNDSIDLTYNGFDYSVKVEKGEVLSKTKIRSVDNKIKLSFNN